MKKDHTPTGAWSLVVNRKEDLLWVFVQENLLRLAPPG
jgi:hypothetical protein